MRNPSRSLSVRPLATALLLGAALVATEATAPAAGAIPRRAIASHGAATPGARHPGVARRVIRPRVGPAASVAIPVSDDVWARLRRCESGGRYDINTGNGFYGAYQFVPRTWRGLGYYGMPHEAPPQVQDEVAQKLQARSGWGQWPACARKLGLR